MPYQAQTACKRHKNSVEQPSLNLAACTRVVRVNYSQTHCQIEHKVKSGKHKTPHRMTLRPR